MTGDVETIREALADDLVWHVPGRHRFSGDRSKVDTVALFEEAFRSSPRRVSL